METKMVFDTAKMVGLSLKRKSVASQSYKTLANILYFICISQTIFTKKKYLVQRNASIVNICCKNSVDKARLNIKGSESFLFTKSNYCQVEQIN